MAEKPKAKLKISHVNYAAWGSVPDEQIDTIFKTFRDSITRQIIDGLRDMNEGETRMITLPTYKEAQRVQSLMTGVAKALNWPKQPREKRYAYRTRIVKSEASEQAHLYIQRLIVLIGR